MDDTTRRRLARYLEGGLLFAAKGADLAEARAHPGLSALDAQVVIDEMEGGATHLFNAVLELHPGWADLDDRRLGWQLDKLTNRRRKVLDRVPVCLCCYAKSAHAHLGAAVRLLLEEGVIGGLADDTARAVGHLERALYVLDPKEVQAWLDATLDADARGRLAARIEELRADVEVSRAVAGR